VAAIAGIVIAVSGGGGGGGHDYAPVCPWLIIKI
jgi:hypothetical protein